MANDGTADRVLSVLENDAQASYAEIARRVGVSKPTVRKYVKQLEADGVIVGYSADVDPKKLSSQSIALVGIETASDEYVDVIRELQELTAVETLYSCTGDHMLIAEVRAPDGDTLGEVIRNNIVTIPGATAAHPSFLQERLK